MRLWLGVSVATVAAVVAATGAFGSGSGGDTIATGAATTRAAAAKPFVGPKTTSAPLQRSAVQAGGYSGRQAQHSSYPVTFFVPAGARSVLNFSISQVQTGCVGGGGIVTLFKILKTTIKRNRSFTAKASQIGVVGAGANVKLTYTVSGRFLGKNAAGAATAEGEYRVDILNLDTNVKCTSNNQSWAATKSSQPPPRRSVTPGAYSGPQSQHSSYPVTFRVPAGARSVLNFSISQVSTGCGGGGGAGSPAFKILTATIKPDRSFTATASQDVVLSGFNAKITYFVTGYFQGNNSAGAPTAEGVYRLDVLFTDNNRKCTSNNASWAATRTG